MDKIDFTDDELKTIKAKTGLSYLEVRGIVAVMNDIIEPKIRRQRQYDEDERMGRNIY